MISSSHSKPSKAWNGLVIPHLYPPSLMKTFGLALLFLCLSSFMFAQPIVHICIEKVGNDLEVKLFPMADFQGVVSNIQFAIKCEDPSVTYGVPTQGASQSVYMPTTKEGVETTFLGNKYQKFAAAGLVNMSGSSVQWTAQQFVPLMTITPSNINANFTIENDLWTVEDNANFYVELNGLNKTGTSNSVCLASAFPLEMGPLTAEWNNSDARLTWTIYAEDGLSHFEVERRGMQGGFETVATTLPQAATHFPKAYGFTDIKPDNALGEMLYYRIKALTFDGEAHYSNIALLRREAGMSVTYYPNPTQDQLHLIVSLTETSPIKLSIFDLSGRELYTYQTDTQDLQHLIPTQNWAAGCYFLQVSANGKSEVYKVVKE